MIDEPFHPETFIDDIADLILMNLEAEHDKVTPETILLMLPDLLTALTERVSTN